MGCFTTKGGYESPAIGTYVWGLVMQMSAGTLMLMVGSGSFRYDDFFGAISRPEELANRGKVMTAMGSLHVVFVLIMAAVLMAGFFISECFLIPLCIISIAQMVYCIVSSGVAGYYWKFENDRRGEKLGLNEINDGRWIRIPGIYADTIDLDAGVIYASAVLTLGCLVAYSRGSSIDEDTPAPEVAMYVPTITMATCLGALLLIGAPNLKETRVMGIIWLLIAWGLALVINLSRCWCCPKIFNLVVGACFAAVVAGAVISASHFAHWYGVGRYTYLALTTRTIPVSSDYKAPLLIYMYLNLGTGLIVAFLLSMAMTLFSIFCVVYALRSVLCCCGKTASAPKPAPAPAPATAPEESPA